MYKIDNLTDFYQIVGRELLTNGEITNPRGYETKELLNVSFCLSNPRANVIKHPKRKFNNLYALVESLMLIFPTDDLRVFSLFNKNIHKFSDDGEKLYGAYGMRVSQTIERVIERLKADPDTRQAVIPILSSRDINTDTKDTPCTSFIQFMIRNGKLNAHVTMRSNDILWGTQYDVYMFTTLQMIIANTLDVKLGNYYHNVNSLHVYKDFNGFMGYEELENLAYGLETVQLYDVNPFNYERWYQLARWYVQCVTSGYVDKPPVVTASIMVLMDEMRKRLK